MDQAGVVMQPTSVAHALSGRLSAFALIALSALLLTGCPMNNESQTNPSLLSDASLPRFTKLPLFDPHRKSFECKHEAEVNPPITSEAEALFQQAMATTSHDLWEEDRNYVKAAQLYEQAMKLGHWKAQFNLASLYLKGWGVPQDTERAIELTEDLMRKGVPAAWDNMGTMYMGGIGSLKQDASVAYAFWQRAADMGSMASQAYIGAKLLGNHDEPPSFWGNRSIGLKMLECAVAQGSGLAAYELGVTMDVEGKNRVRALQVLHEGVKLGSERSAGSLSSSFRHGRDLVGRIPDISRADRYHVLANALHLNPDLRFPNLDKVLPLPPTPLPKWDGNKQTLIDAAKAVVPAPPAPSKPEAPPASQRTGRAHIPEGHALPEQPQWPMPAQYETTAAPQGGYWIARLMHPHSARHLAWNAAQVPLRYERGEPFESSREGLEVADGRILFHYLGVPVAEAPPPQADVHPKVAQGAARQACLPQPLRRWRGGGDPCPTSGIWAASVPADHPAAAVFNGWHRQTYVRQGQPFPDPRDAHLDIEPSWITWIWWDQANPHWPSDVEHISLDGQAPTT